MAMSCSMATSPKALYRVSWLFRTTFLALTTLFYINTVSCSKPAIPSSHDRCGLIVPESNPVASELKTIPFPPDQDGYYHGGDDLLNHRRSSHYYYSPKSRKVLLFRTHNVYSTDVDGVYKVEASLIIQPERILHRFSGSSQTISTWSEDGALSFEIEGFWSKSTGKLCMVGSTSTYSAEGQHRRLSAVLMLNDVRGQSNITSLVRGRLESLSSTDDPSYFEPISVLMFPLMNYTYKVAKEADYGCSGGVEAANNALRLPLSFSLCSVFFQTVNSFELKYSNGCNLAKDCNPLGKDEGNLPQIMSLNSFQCSADKRSLRFLVEFLSNGSYESYYTPFNPNTTFVAEGSWNAEKNQLCAVACRILTSNNSLENSQVEDCSMRLSLRFPSVLSIRNTSSIVGHIWVNKTAEISFNNINFDSYGSTGVLIPRLKYEYTLVDRARNSCPKKQSKRREGWRYPDANTYNMQFQMSFRYRKGRKLSWGYANLFSVGDKIAPSNSFSMSENSVAEEKLHPQNVSFKISLTSFNDSSKDYRQISISAEGIYDGETGVLCMAGCKYLEQNNQKSVNDPMDCDIVVNIQFPPLKSGEHIEGRIESTRDKSSPLHFESLYFSAIPYYSHRETMWRMDLEIIMALISNTLICIFVGCQIWYVKKHPSVFPFISLVMVVVLALGYMIPLMLNFEALFFSKQNLQFFIRSSGGWLEVNEVIVRVVTMVAFLLQIRLLQLVSSARLADENQKAAWIAERKTLYVLVPLYVAGGLIALLVNWKKYNFGERMNYRYIDSQQHSLWADLRAYAGLILDAFLLPQILLNIFHNSRENVLSCFFYMGTTFVRMLPHGYDLYRTHFYVDDFYWSYTYADPSADYYSTAWDMIIPVGGVVFAGILYLQQRNGGRCFFPKRFKELQGYEKVPVACDT